jgi:hypothetical protein
MFLHFFSSFSYFLAAFLFWHSQQAEQKAQRSRAKHQQEDHQWRGRS